LTITIGIDPHKSSHTASAIENATLVDRSTIRVRATKNSVRDLLAWAAKWPDRVWAIEGARGLGYLLAQQLVAAGEHVVDVPSTLTSRVRLLETGGGRKTDQVDARTVAVIAAKRDLPMVCAEDHSQLLRLLADQRGELAQTRRRTINRLHRHLRDLIAGGAPIHLSSTTAAKLLAKVRPVTVVEAERKRIARDLLAEIRRLDKAMAENRRRSRDAIEASGTTLTEIYGISDVLAAKIIGQIGTIERFPSADHLASYAGTAPIEASSGDVVRHRLSRRGNRQLNNAIHLAAHVQSIRPGTGQDYFQRRIDNGDSRKEALRALKRQITKAIYRTMSLDLQRQLIPTG